MIEQMTWGKQLNKVFTVERKREKLGKLLFLTGLTGLQANQKPPLQLTWLI